MANKSVFLGERAVGPVAEVEFVDRGDGKLVMPVALRGKNAAEGDTPVLVDSNGKLRIVGEASFGIDGQGDSLGFTAPGASTVRPLAAAGWLYNGTNFDRQRNNTEGTALASAARTATTYSADITNHNASGIVLIVNVTAYGGAGSITLAIEVKDPVSGGYPSLILTGAITAVGTYKYVIYPGIAAPVSMTTGLNGTAGYPLPRTFRIRSTHADATSHTYSVGYALIL